MTFHDNIAALQIFADVEVDRDFGPITAEALVKKLGLPPPPAASMGGWNNVKASSFADPADIRGFKRCKDRGGSDQECFKVGDNGIGMWGDDTTVDRPMCALPREIWRPFGTFARGKKVFVQFNDKIVQCELRDTMPSLANIRNGAGIDLNPAAGRALGLEPPFLVRVRWRWV